ncbi:universal stress protein [Actinocorallia populi]|uniref:universal stress protein n=1 Tax=Actinocorallia populi TaxID=2079200 RepID=UPI0018E4E984|nr:universal stress protein [Actinocorallia populi]
MTRRHGVLVGYDGSEGGDLALDWAAEEAVLRGLPLTVCHVWQIVYPGFVVMPVTTLSDAAESITRTAAERVSGAHPGLEVRRLVESGSPAYALIEHAREAGLTVVGSEGAGTVRKALLGSVSAQVTAHASGAVTVVRPTFGQGSRPGRIVAGVDGSPAADHALGAAFEEAHLRRTGLTVLCVCPENAGVRDTPFVDDGVLRELSRERFERSVDSWRAKYPQVRAEKVFLEGDPVTELINASEGAVLLVVGSRGVGGIRSMLLGSVSDAAVRHALCSVTVVHPPEE